MDELKLSDADRKHFADIYNDLNFYPTIDDVAKRLGKAPKTVRNIAGWMRRTPNAPSLIGRARRSASTTPQTRGRVNENPVSEKPQLYMEHWTAEDCIERLLNIVAEYEDKIISRAFFNKVSGISESTWDRYFGTFEQFKRSAGVTLNRGAHRLELDISKHAGADAYRLLNVDRGNYEGKYLKPNNKRFKTALVISDVHDKECDPFVRRVFIDVAGRMQPDTIVFNGDIFDLPEFGKYGVDPRRWDVTGRIKWVHTFLGDLRNVCPDAEFIFIEGNHEFRLMRHLADATPALKVVLADICGLTVPKLLGLDQFEVNYVAKADLAVFREIDMRKEIGRNWHVLWNQLLAHHFPDARHWGVPGWNGHHHKHIVYPHYTLNYGSSEWHQLGSAHVRNAEYCNGEKWSNGILAAHADTQRQRSVFEYSDIRDFCVIGGVYYERTPEEKTFKEQGAELKGFEVR